MFTIFYKICICLLTFFSLLKPNGLMHKKMEIYIYCRAVFLSLITLFSGEERKSKLTLCVLVGGLPTPPFTSHWKRIKFVASQLIQNKTPVCQIHTAGLSPYHLFHLQNTIPCLETMFRNNQNGCFLYIQEE